MPGSALQLLRRPARLVRRLCTKGPGTVAALLMAVTAAGAFLVPATAQAGPLPNAPVSTAGKAPFVSFPAFLSSVSSARYASLAARGAVGAVRSQAAFNQMRSYVLNLYQGVQVTHSYVDNGSYFDCMVTMTQPAVRMHHPTGLATPPPLPRVSARTGKAAPSLLSLGRKDAYGNAISCPQGTVPMQRLSLDRLMGFPTLRDFMAKGPARAGITPGGPHRYAVGRQGVSNFGGGTTLNLWNPSGDFTLSQQWVVNFGSTTQTAEVGWVH